MAIDKSYRDLTTSPTGLERVRKVSPGKRSTFAGGRINGYPADGGLAPAAMLNVPNVRATQPQRFFNIADTDNFVIRKVDATGHNLHFRERSEFQLPASRYPRSKANTCTIADAGAFGDVEKSLRFWGRERVRGRPYGLRR